MPNGEEWLLRAWVRGRINYESYKNGAIDLEDIAVMNDALDVSDENERRIREANAPPTH